MCMGVHTHECTPNILVTRSATEEGCEHAKQGHQAQEMSKAEKINCNLLHSPSGITKDGGGKVL